MSSQGNRPTNLDVSRVMEPSTASNSRNTHPQKGTNSERAFFQLDMIRSLQLHRRLTLSIAAAGLVLGLIYYFAMAPDLYSTRSAQHHPARLCQSLAL
jgi:hypothetical protein